jgi:hypothetical protein
VYFVRFGVYGVAIYRDKVWVITLRFRATSFRVIRVKLNIVY